MDERPTPESRDQRPKPPFRTERLDPHKGRDVSGDTFGIYVPSFDETGRRKPDALINYIAGQGARREAEKLAGGLNKAWDEFHGIRRDE